MPEDARSAPRRSPRIAAVLLALLPLTHGAAAGARPARHPDVAAERAVQDCDGCHRRLTPAVVAQWEGSPHGVALVKCLVCHGSTGSDFTRAPRPERCRGCHPAELASVTPAGGRPRPCLGCHAPHALAAPGRKSPHEK